MQKQCIIIKKQPDYDDEKLQIIACLLILLLLIVLDLMYDISGCNLATMFGLNI